MKRGTWTIPFALAVLLVVSAEPPASRLAAAPQSAQSQEKVQSTQAKPEDKPVEQPPDFKAFNEAGKISDVKKRIEAYEKFLVDYPDSMLVSMVASNIESQLLDSISGDTKKLLARVDNRAEATGNGTVSTYSMLARNLLRAGILLEEAEKLAEKAAATDAQKYIDEVRAHEHKTKTDEGKGTRTGSAQLTFSGGAMTATYKPRDPNLPLLHREQTDAELRAAFRSRHAELLTTLGQIYLKRGKTAEAEKTLKDAYAEDRPIAAARELAAFARKTGDDSALLEYLTTCVLGGASTDVRKEFDDVYRKTHNGSLEGLEAMLDERYLKSMPHIDVKPFERPRTKDSRLALAELFTGVQCGPCIPVDLAFDAALERFGPQDLALIVYHEHIPGPDPMTNPSTEKRLKFYGVSGVPAFYIDGVTDGAGGGGAELAGSILNERISPATEKALASKPAARLDLTATMVGTTIRVKAGASRIASKSDKLKLQIALVEELLKYSGSNGVRFHPMVVRAMATTPVKKAAAPKESTPAGAAAADEQGFAIAPGKGLKVEYVFDLTKIVADNKKLIDDFLTKSFRGGDKPTFSSRMDDIDPKHLVIVAFVQDEDAKQGSGETIVGGKPTQREVPLRHILQAASVKIGATKTTN